MSCVIHEPTEEVQFGSRADRVQQALGLFGRFEMRAGRHPAGFPKVLACCLAIGAGTSAGFAAAADSESLRTTQAELRQLSLEELGNLEVTTVSKKPEAVSTTAAAIYVITGEEIRRSGVTTLPEALRLAPGLDVAQLDAHTWAISARGFNDQYANKLLVLMDGRSVYTPLFSGVYWDVQDTVLADVDRIEVVRGPGGTMWGANAVNGVINIITKSSRETQGLLLHGGSGTEERGVANLRYGGRLGEHAHYRVFGKYFNRDDAALANGDPADDSWWMGRGGFRTDWEPTDDNRLTLQGDLYNGQLKKTFTTYSVVPPFTPLVNDLLKAEGGNVLGRFSRQFSTDANVSVQLYYDRMRRASTVAQEDRDTADLDLQHRFRLGERHALIWGGGYRYSHDDINESYNLTPSQLSHDTHLANAFVQDEITLVPDRFRLTMGTKLEHNDFTGFEWQPSGRFSWTPHPRHTVWASVARAVRTPSRTEWEMELIRQLVPPFSPTGVVPSLPFPAILSFRGNHDFVSENLIAYELGYRVQPHARLWLDATVFYNDYDHLRSIEPGAPTLKTSPATYVFVPVNADNNVFGETYGGELAGHWQAAEWWQWHASYTFLQMQLHKRPGSGDPIQEPTEGNSPHHQIALYSRMNLPGHVELDAGLRFVDSLPNLRVSSYWTAELRLAWKPRPNLELALLGRNLLDSQHAEFQGTFLKSQPTEIERSVFGSLLWRF